VKLLLDKTIDVLGMIKDDIIHTMEDMDTRDWPHQAKYANADLNALFVLVTSTEAYAKELLVTHAALIENEDNPRLKGED
jgi:hypothetical protein